MTGVNRTPKNLVIFLREAARYFENRDTGGEDRAYWANVYNAENCIAAAELITALERDLKNLQADYAEQLGRNETLECKLSDLEYEIRERS